MKDLTLEFSCICSEVSVDFHSAQIKPNLCLVLFIYGTKKTNYLLIKFNMNVYMQYSLLIDLNKDI